MLDSALVTQLILFVAALFGVPWLISEVLPPPSGSLASILASLLPTVWAPTIIALAFVSAEGGRSGLRRELRERFRYVPGTGRWIVLAIGVPVLAVGLAVAVARSVGSGASFVPLTALAQAVLLQFVTGAVGEELGWRGFLLPRLGRFTGPIIASWIMGALWSAWHIGAFYNPALPHYTMPMPLVLAFILFFGAFMGLLFQQNGQSIMATIAAHLSLNIMTALGGASLASAAFWGVLAAVFAVVSVTASIRMVTFSRRSPLAQSV